MIDLKSMTKELENLKRRYASELQSIVDRAEAALNKLEDGKASTHDAFNIGASTSEAAILAGKIEQTENVIRWMQEAK